MLSNNILVDLLAIIFIIILSYVFLFAGTDSLKSCGTAKTNSYQIMFITFGLCILISYKIANSLINNGTGTNCNNSVELYTATTNKQQQHTQKQHEHFNDFASDISDFINNVSQPQNVLTSGNTGSVDNNTINSYVTALANLQSQLTAFNDKVDAALGGNNSANAVVGVGAGAGNGSDILANRMSVESQQALQSYQIDYLKNQIEKSKSLLNAQLMQQNSAKYKPIKVYSSCAIANADGSVSPTTGNSSAATSNFTDIINQVSLTPQNAELLKTIGQTTTATKPLTNDSNSNGNNMLDALAKLVKGLQGKTILI